MKEVFPSSVGQFDPSFESTAEYDGDVVHGAGADVFGDDTNHQVNLIQADVERYPPANPILGQIRYQTLTWPLVAVLMITEIVTYGTLSLPSALAVVGIVPGVILIAFLGVFALYTSLVLIQFKLNHPDGTSNRTWWLRGLNS